MKKFLVPVIVLAALVLFSAFVFAIPNPAPVYCTEMGYTVEGDNCVFPDGESCNEWEFYNGECGQEYVKELSCADIGNSLLPGHECCEGLVSAASSSGIRVTGGICDYAVGA